MKQFVFIFTFIFFSYFLIAQVGGIDINYYRCMGISSTLGTVTQVVIGNVVEPDSSVIVYGAFSSCNQRVIGNIAKLRPDGNNDYTFNPGTGFNGQVNVVARQSDGKLLVGGGFTQFNGSTCYPLVRLNTNGTLDTSFHNTVITTYYQVYSLAIQPNGQILVGGSYISSPVNILRLNANGTWDNTFHSGSAGMSTLTVFSMILLPDSEILVAGSSMARLKANGTRDSSFAIVNISSGGFIRSAAVQSSGKIIVVGSFTTVNGVSSPYIARINSTGTFDSTFSIGTSFNAALWSVAVQSNDNIVTAGTFTSYNGSALNRIARLGMNGAIDTSYHAAVYGPAYSVCLDSAGNAFVGGTFLTANNYSRSCFAKFTSTGSIDQSFFSASGFNGNVTAAAVQSTGKVLLTGSFTYFGPTPVTNLVRLNTDGTLDTTFHTGTGFNSTINSINVVAADQIYVGGAFTAYNGTSVHYVVRLNSDGSLDNTFLPAFDGSVTDAMPGPNGKIYVSGTFYHIGSTVVKALVRLSTTGVYDNTFPGAHFPNTCCGSSIRKFLFQSDNKIITMQQAVERLDTLGNVDSSFYMGSGPSALFVTAMALQPNGEILLAGSFNYNGFSSQGVYRLKTNGTVDSAFHATIPANPSPNCVIPIFNNGVVDGGGNYNPMDVYDSTGTFDTTTFKLGTSAMDPLLSGNAGIPSALFSDTINHRILVCGNFSNYQGITSPYFAALKYIPTNTALDSITPPIPLCANATAQVKFKNEDVFNTGNVFTVQLSDTGGSFTSPTSIGTLSSSAVKGWDSITITIPSGALSSNHYKMRVTTTNPVYTSAASGYVSIKPNTDTITHTTPLTFCSGGSVTLSSQTQSSYTWGTSATTQSITATTSGTYTLTVSSNGCSATASVAVTVHSLPVVMASSNSPVCSYSTINLTSSLAGVTYAWSGPDTFSSTSQSPTRASSGNGGVYTIVVTDSNSCRASVTTNVIVHAAPVDTISSNSPVCAYDSIRLVITPSNNAYVWSGPDSFSTINQYPILPASGHGGAYSVIVTDSNGCSVSASVNVVVHSAPSISIASNSPVCVYDSILLTATSSTDSFSWSGPNFFDSNIQNPLGRQGYGNEGVYTLVVTDSNGCSATASTAVVVNEPPYAEMSTNSPVCGADTIHFSVYSDIGTYAWSGPDSFSSSSENPNRPASGHGGTYTIQITDSNGCVASVSDSVEVMDLIAPDTIIPQTACSDTTFIFNVSSSAQGCGNAIEWALHSSFDSSHIVASPGVIAFSVGVGATDTLWVRSRDSISGAVSSAVHAIFKVKAKPYPITAPAAQSTCSDTALTFNFDSIVVGSLGNQIEWATNNSFVAAQFVNSPANIALTIGPGSNTNVWLRSVDTVSGCTSDSVNTTAVIHLLPFPINPTASMDTICPNHSVNIIIANAEAGKNYTLEKDTTIITSGYGNGFAINLNTGNIAATSSFSVYATDTASGCGVWLSPIVTVQVDSVLSAPAFTAGDTLLYYGQTSQYAAQNIGDSSLRYFIDSGSATIDSVTGWVSNVTSGFIVGVNTIAAGGCTVANGYMHVTYLSKLGPPVAPAPQSAWSDTAVTFTLSNITAGIGGNEIEWATNRRFDSSTIISSPGNLSFTVDTGKIDTIWFRTLSSIVSTITDTLMAGDLSSSTSHALRSDPVMTYLQVIHVPANASGLSSNPVQYVTLPSGDNSGSGGPVGTTPGFEGTTPTGGLTYTVPIACPPGTNNMVPKIALNYNSNSGNGLMGWGWAISGLSSISRSGLDYFHDQQVTPIQLNGNDAFNIDGTRLTLISGTNGADGAVYAKEVEDYSVITAKESSTFAGLSFIVTTKQGITMEYGNTNDSRFFAAGTSQILQWRLDKVTDQDGNYVSYAYDNSEGAPRIKEIHYTGNDAQGVAPYAAILFKYQQRFDENTVYTANTPCHNNSLLMNISVMNGSNTFKNYELDYTQDDLSSYLAAIYESGSDGTTLNPTVFKYGTAPTNNSCHVTAGEINPNWDPFVSYAYNAYGHALTTDPYYYTDKATQAAISGDFNGDGYSDQLLLYQLTTAPAVADGEITPYNIAFMVNFNSGNQSSPTFINPKEVNKYPDDRAFLASGGTSFPINYDHENYDYYVGDFLGIGRDGILEVQKYYNNTIVGYTHDGDIYNHNLQLGSIKYYTYDKAGNQTITAFTTPPYEETEAGTPLFYVGDFDGDGRMDYMYENSIGFYISLPSKGIFNVLIGGDINNLANLITPDAVPTLGTNGQLIYSTGGNLVSYIGDYDGDGKQDVMIVGYNNSYVYNFVDEGGGAYSLNLGQTLLYPNFTTNDQIYLGDFNGDGKTDILTHKINTYAPVSSNIAVTTRWGGNVTLHMTTYPSPDDDVSDDVWEIGSSTGSLFSKQPFIENKFLLGGGGYGHFECNGVVENIFESKTDYLAALHSSQQFIIADFNGDGKSDILSNIVPLASSAGAFLFTSSSINTQLYYSQGNQFMQYSLSSVYPIPGALSTVGDFNGDGRTDVAFYGVEYAGYNYFQYEFNPLGQERLLQSVTDGFNQVKSFTYKPITDATVHTMGNSNFAIPPASVPSGGIGANPLTSVQMPLYALASLTIPDGIGGNNVTTYNYQNALMHHQGRGFLGFEDIISNTIVSSEAVSTNLYTDVNTHFESPYYFPTGIIKNSTIGFTNTQYKQVYLGIPNHYAVQRISDYVSDYIANTTTESDYSYTDGYGNVNGLIQNKGNGIEVTSTQSLFGKFGNMTVLGKPVSVTTTHTRTGASAVTSVITNSFDYLGHLTSVTPSDACGVTYQYGHDNFGNIDAQTSYLGPSEAGFRTKSVNYDNNGRYQKTSTNALMQQSQMQYDPKSGKVNWIKGVDGVVTTCNYDGFGNIISVVTPRGDAFGYSNSIVYAWDIGYNGTQSQYSITNTVPGRPVVKVWYDAMGREVLRNTVGYGGNILTSKITYTVLNKTHTITKPYYSTESPPVTTFSYNSLNQPVEVVDPLTTNDISYDYEDNLTITKSNPASGRSSSQTTDPSGKLISAADAGGTLSYKYDSRGNQIQVKNSSTILMTAVYDACNHKTVVDEPNSGHFTYQYDGYGELLTQTDGNSVTYNMLYDAAGRLTQQSTGSTTAEKSTYAYYTTGYGLNHLESITGFSSGNHGSSSQHYTYDAFYDVTDVTETINGTTYSTDYSFDIYGNNTSITYPSALTINNNYDAYGYLLSIVEGSGPTLYTVNQMNGFGQATSYTLGNGLTSTISTNYGVPTEFKTTGIQDLILDYCWNTGDLISRQDDVPSGTFSLIANSETFTYDDADRLTSAKANSNAAINFTFADNGNIVNKPDAGDYTYDHTKTNSVTSVSNPDNNISSNTQNITYIGFNKASEITENGYTLDYTYAADYNRKYSILTYTDPSTSATSTINSRVYSGNYEVNNDYHGNTNQQIHYIFGNNRLVAMVVVDSSGTNEYYTYTDNLGSILKVTDKYATVVASQNFDAWGRIRNSSDYSYPTTAIALPSFLYRGYCGHEMLSQFGLINMNGRMYDPLLGRMLSPDNQVGDPMSTQSYNRYSYVTNNPLKYTDPTGWLGEDGGGWYDNGNDDENGEGGGGSYYGMEGDQYLGTDGAGEGSSATNNNTDQASSSSNSSDSGESTNTGDNSQQFNGTVTTTVGIDGKTYTSLFVGPTSYEGGTLPDINITPTDAIAATAMDQQSVNSAGENSGGGTIENTQQSEQNGPGGEESKTDQAGFVTGFVGVSFTILSWEDKIRGATRIAEAFDHGSTTLGGLGVGIQYYGLYSQPKKITFGQAVDLEVNYVSVAVPIAIGAGIALGILTSPVWGTALVVTGVVGVSFGITEGYTYLTTPDHETLFQKLLDH